MSLCFCDVLGATSALAGQLNYSDIDAENKHDIFQSPEYAQDIFNYYKSQEVRRYRPLECLNVPMVRLQGCQILSRCFCVNGALLCEVMVI